MLTASEARYQTTVTDPTKLPRFADVDKCIRNAITKGEFHTWVYGSLDDRLISHLRGLGYHVMKSSDRNETLIKISWENA